MSLLTDKEIQTAQDAVFATHKITWEGLVCDFLDPSMCSPSDVEQALIEMADAVADASQTKTLKAVGEWVLDNYEPGEDCRCIMFVNNLVNGLREGKAVWETPQ